MSGTASKVEFFRQSGWMLIAGTIGGVFMYLTHVPAQKILGKSDYGVFVTLLQWLNLMAIPSLGLQTVFAQQAAAALTPAQEENLRSTIRAIGGLAFLLWISIAITAWVFRFNLLNLLRTDEVLAVWVTLCLGLMSLWTPLITGLLQGRQNFLWLGIISILSGLGRFGSVYLILNFVGGRAASAMGGAFIGMLAALITGCWQNASLLTGPGRAFSWRPWMARVIPLTLGLGATQFMFSVDMIVVRSVFDRDQTGFYAAAGMIGRALVTFTGPMMVVMFPKIVRSAARSEKSNVLGQALGATALLGVGAAVACTLFPSLPLRLVYASAFLEISPLVPWFAWCMLPLTLSNVLVGNLLAREQFKVVPWLVLVAGGYLAALLFQSNDLLRLPQMAAFTRVIQTLGLFGTLLFLVAAWFTWTKSNKLKIKN